MTKCKKEDCNNIAVKDKEYCKYHQSKKEETFRNITGLAVPILLTGVGLFRKFTK